ncbi:MAG: M20/M25/M40 family metallo-hydrolase [Clostridia bacterium]|nr:M20/M25/M40 family metallo-hydrolase [Clostridia bacterium]
MEKYKILKDLIAFDTIKDKENKLIIEYIESYLKKYGFKTECKNKYLIMSIGKEQKIGFLGHTDTVEYTKGWKTNPFELIKIDDKLYGLGVCDMKGGIATMLEAISQINFNDLKYGIKLYFTYDEEICFNGIYDIIKSKEIFPEIMIFGEPTNNQILIGSKGLLEYKLYFKGKKAHSSNPEKGKSANLNAIKFIFELNEFYENKIKQFKEDKYEISYTTMNVGLINGGSAINSVSAECNVSIDFRIVIEEHIKIIKEKIEELAQKYECKINIIEEVEPFFNDVSVITSSIKTANFITEASFIKQNNVRKIILGLGEITAHEIDENITEESYDMLIKQYKELILKICK